MISAASGNTDFYRLQPMALWRAFRAEGLAFWLLCTYVMFEYVRPQTAYPVLDILPWSTGMMLLTGMASLASRKTVSVRSPAHWVLCLFSFVLLLSSIAAYRPDQAYTAFKDYFLWVLAYILITQVVVNERRMLLFILAFVVFNLKMSLFAARSWAAIGFVFRDWGVTGAPGFFQNSGEFGIEMCVFFPIATYLAFGLKPHLPVWKYWMLLAVSGTSLVGMIASSSRGALLGGASVTAFMLARSRYKVRALVAGVLIIGVGYLAIPSQQKARLAASGSDGTSQLRLTYWRHGIEMANRYPLLGVGYNNWEAYYSAHFAGRHQVSHNIFIQAVSELGYTGLLAFLLLIGCTFVVNARSRRLAIRAGPGGRLTYCLAHGLDGALVGFMVSGFFVTVMYYPYFWINLSMTVALNTVAKRLPVPHPNITGAPHMATRVTTALPPALSGRPSATSVSS